MAPFEVWVGKDCLLACWLGGRSSQPAPFSRPHFPSMTFYTSPSMWLGSNPKKAGGWQALPGPAVGKKCQKWAFLDFGSFRPRVSSRNAHHFGHLPYGRFTMPWSACLGRHPQVAPETLPPAGGGGRQGCYVMPAPNTPHGVCTRLKKRPVPEGREISHKIQKVLDLPKVRALCLRTDVLKCRIFEGS